MQHLLKNALLKDSREQQVISGHGWSFGTIKTNNLRVDGLVNGININPLHGDIVFVDTDYSKPINITSDIRFTHPSGSTLSQSTYISGALNCDVSELFGSSIKIQRNIWNAVHINRHVDCSLGQNVSMSTGLLHFFSHAVRSSIDQSFYGNVSFYLANPAVSGIILRQANDWNGALPLTIDGILLDNILTDAVIDDIDPTKPLVIHGQKQFLSDNLKIDGSLNVKKHFQADIINQVNLLQLNASIIRKDQDLIHIPTGQQISFLHPPTFGNMAIDAHLSINGVPIVDIFFASSNATHPVPQITISKPNSQLPRANENDDNPFHVENLLNLNLVNDVSLDHFLENRIRKYPAFNAQGQPEAQFINGSLTFENLVIAGHRSTLHSINDCEMNEIVHTHSDETQYILGHKHVAGPSNPSNGNERGFIVVNSPSVLLNVNGQDFLQEYSKSIFLNENITLNALDVPNPFYVDTANGLFIQNTINGMNLNDGEIVGSAQYTKYDVSQWRMLNQNLEHKMSKAVKKLRYIDRSDVFQVIRNNSQLLNAAENANQLYSTWMTIDSLYTGQNGNKPGSAGYFVCPVQYHIRSLNWPSRKIIVHREEPFSRILTVSLHPNFVIHVHTEFPSTQHYFVNCNFTKPAANRPLSIIYINQKQVLTFDEDLIESVNVFYMPDDLVYVLVHIHRKHIAVLRGSFSRPYDQWQIMQKIPCPNNDMDAATITNEHLFSWQGILLLVVSSSAPISDSLNQNQPQSPHSTLVYRFHIHHEKFYQVHEVSGDYNTINGLEVRADNQTAASESHFILILGKQQTKFLTTWTISIKKDAHNSSIDYLHFELQEKLNFNVAIRTISTFAEFGTEML